MVERPKTPLPVERQATTTTTIEQLLHLGLDFPAICLVRRFFFSIGILKQLKMLVGQVAVVRIEVLSISEMSEYCKCSLCTLSQYKPHGV